MKILKPMGTEILEAAIAAARRGVTEMQLSGRARAAIFEAVWAQTDPVPGTLRPLFASPRRLAIAGALPLLLAAGMLALLGRSGPPPVSSVSGASGTMHLEVSKEGDQVCFRIANGKRSHSVSRSTEPDRFDATSAVHIAEGAYSDRLDGPTDLVFYRID